MITLTTFTELFREAKEDKKLVARPINQDLQKHIDSLNKMFAENWSPLFDKDKDYKLWSDYANHVYFGNDFQYTLVVKNLLLIGIKNVLFFIFNI